MARFDRKEIWIKFQDYGQQQPTTKTILPLGSLGSTYLGAGSRNPAPMPGPTPKNQAAGAAAAAQQKPPGSRSNSAAVAAAINQPARNILFSSDDIRL